MTHCTKGNFPIGKQSHQGDRTGVGCWRREGDLGEEGFRQGRRAGEPTLCPPLRPSESLGGTQSQEVVRKKEAAPQEEGCQD